MNKTNYTFEQSLMGYLKARDKKMVCGILCHLTPEARERLCASLLDYMETGLSTPPNDVLLGGAYLYLTQRLNSLTPAPSQGKGLG